MACFLGIAATAALLVRPSSNPAAAAPAVRPNFVLIVTDDQRWDTIGRCYGGFDGADLNAGPDSCMPFLQQHLTSAGTTFSRGYVTTSLCCPARTSILKGLYARHTGVLDNQSLDAFEDASTLPVWLDAAGYRTGLIGKYTNGYGDGSSLPPNYVPPGWDSWHAFWGRPSYTSYSLVHRDPGETAATVAYTGTQTAANNSPAPTPCESIPYSTDHLCSLARDFVAADQADPFFLLFAPFSPHLNPIWPSRWDSLYRQELTLPTYPSQNRVPEPNPPSYLPRQPLTQTEQNINAYNFRAQLRTNRAVDDAIHALHEQLRVDGRLDETVWIYLSDNGLARGEQRWGGKACEYEICHRVPFVVVCPPLVCPGGRAGQHDRNNLALNIDIAPTIAELAGITPPDPMDGRSLVPLLTGASVPWRTSFLLEDHGLRPSNRPLGIVSMLEDGHVYKFVRFLSTPTEFELFDLTNDPWEISNLAFDPTYASIRSRLSDALDAAFNGPAVTITSGPPETGTERNVRFTWTSSRDATFACTLDGATGPCGEGTSGSIDYANVADGTHTFRLSATDASGTSGEPAAWTFTIGAPSETPAPPSFTLVPPNPSLPDVTFSFQHPMSGMSFGCSLDGAPFLNCSSPHTLTGLSGGSHQFRVRAVSGTAVSDATAHAWSVDAAEPSVAITSEADRFMTDTKIGIVWSGADDTGIVRYDVFQRNGTRAPQVLATSTTDTRYVHTAPAGSTSCYQVVAIDGAGRRGTSTEICRAVPFDDRAASLTYQGSPLRVAATGAFGSTLTLLDGTGDLVRFSFSGRRYGLLMRQGPSLGQADVLLDGTTATRVDLYAPTIRDRVYVFEPFVSDGPHTVTVAWTGARNPSSSGTDVAVDGLAAITWGA